MITLSLCLYVDTKPEKVTECLEAIKDIADEIIIVDSSKNVNLNDLYGNYTKKIYKYENDGDISKAFEFGFSFSTMDYIMWLEQEDIISASDIEKLSKLKNSINQSVDTVRINHSFIDEKSKEIIAAFTRNRIVKRNNYFTWQSGLSHYLPASGKILDSDISITRLVYDSKDYFQRFSIYEERLEKCEKLDARELYYYAEKLYGRKLYDKAMEYYDKFLKDKDGWIGDKLSSIDKITDICHEKGDKEKELNYLLRSFEFALPRAEFLCKLGILFTERGEIDKAIYWYNLAASLEKPKDDLGFRKEECWTWFPHFKLCGCYFRIKDYVSANKHNEIALSFNPMDKSILYNKALLKELLSKQAASNSIEPLKSTKSSLARPLKIVQVAPDVYPVPPENYGGIEAVVYELTEELVKQGHDVYLFAPKVSKTSAKLIPYIHNSKGDYNQIVDFVLKNLPEGVDIIHDHTLVSALGRKDLNIPTVCTIHGTINYKVKYPVFVSKRAREVIGGNHGFYVYNGLNLKEYEFLEDKQDYMLYLGRLDKIKGLDIALDIADKTKKKLVIAGPVHDFNYYSKVVEPRIKNNSRIEYIGSVGGKKKQEILKHASCLLFPTSWEEPFGLVMIEAMACGTPVLALSNGAVPEVLKGFPQLICKSAEEMIQKVEASNFPHPNSLREYVLNNFTTENMAAGYLEIYRKLCTELENNSADNNLQNNKTSNNISYENSKVSEKDSNENHIFTKVNIIKNKRKLKIAQIAPDAFPCPPKDYGGIERVVYDLTEELVKLGHEVILYASEGSKSSGKLITYEKNGANPFKIVDFVRKNLPNDVDIIHDHTHACVMNQCGLQVPVINTIHDSRKNEAKFPVYLCKKALQNVGFGNGFYVYNGINPLDYEFNEKKNDYLIFMGLLYSHKGIKFALDVAERTGQTLIVAGPIYDINYYRNEIEPKIRKNSNIKYVGSVGGKDRQNLLKNARCMVFPTMWEEPFGLVMIESMACGTPVVAFGNGAVPEVLSGFPDLICKNVDEMIYKVQNQVFPDSYELRKYVENKFSAKNMAQSYLEIYEKIIFENK